MEAHCSFVTGCCLLPMLAISCSSGVDVEEKSKLAADAVKNPVTADQKNDTIEKVGGKQSASNPSKSAQGEKDGLKNGVKNKSRKIDASSPVEKKGDHIVVYGDPNDRTLGKHEGEKEKEEKVREPKGKPKEESSKGGSSGDLTTQRTENSQGEGCEVANSCKVPETQLVACLRVPGNDSPDLSLLIQNRGKSTHTLVISAPDYVDLERKKVEVKQNENQKTIIRWRLVLEMLIPCTSYLFNFIVPTAGSGHCDLGFRDLIGLSSIDHESKTTPKSTYITFLTQVPSLVLMSLVALLLIGSACAWVAYRKRHSVGSDSKYQRLDMEHSVAPGGSGRTETDINDGWDNSWDDEWDDEEAPSTPSVPLTPSFSSKGMSSRRLVGVNSGVCVKTLDVGVNPGVCVKTLEGS